MFGKMLPYVNNKDGIALIYVMLTFVILVMLTTSVAFVYSSNLKQASGQEANMEAHYLMLAGIDVTKSTLLMPLEYDEGEPVSMIDVIIAGNITNLVDNLEIDGQVINIEVDYDEDEKEIIITSSIDGISHNLTLKLDVSGQTYREHWE